VKLKALHEQGVANESDSQSFNVEWLSWMNQNDGVVGVFGEQLNAVGLSAKALNGYFVA
jgi:hypothetical protein